MNSIRFIRTTLFGMSQSEFAKMINRTQATVSRWESGTPFTNEDMAAIREAAKSRPIEWKDGYFFAEEMTPRTDLNPSEVTA